MREIDLHIHTNGSDGTCRPEEVVRLAREAGLRAIAVTDHDSLLGCEAAQAAGREFGVEVVPGIEISTKFRRSVHILGYYIDPRSPALAPVLSWEVQDREERNRKMAALMAADGLPVSYEQLRERFGPAMGRPHFARVLVELGLAADIDDAFVRFVDKDRKYYVGRHIFPIERSVEIIREAGGVPVLAHPFQYKLDDAGLRELIEYCIGHGLQGIECRYSGYDAGMVDYLLRLAEEYRLTPTGGSDFHGSNKPQISLGSGLGGELEVPYEYLERLKEIRKEVHSA